MRLATLEQQMRFARKLGLLLAVLALLTGECIARVVGMWTPEELTEKSSFVCNGTPTEVVTNGETGTKGHALFPTVGYSAKIRVLKVLKGGPTIATITLRYFHIASGFQLVPGAVMQDGPREICLEQGRRYRLYLRRSEEQQVYVPCLMGASIDDGSSAEAFAEGQADDSKPFTIGEAVKMAEDYLKKNRPDTAIESSATFAQYWSEGCWDAKPMSPPYWEVTFYRKAPGGVPSTYIETIKKGPVAVIRLENDGKLSGQLP